MRIFLGYYFSQAKFYLETLYAQWVYVIGLLFLQNHFLSLQKLRFGEILLEYLELFHKGYYHIVCYGNMDGLPNWKWSPFQKLVFISLEIALEIFNNQKQHSFEDSMHGIQLKMAHVETIFIVQKHNFRVDNVEPYQLFSYFLLV